MWRKNESPLFQDTIALVQDRRLAIGSNNSLVVTNVTREDTGDYRCEVLGENINVTHRVFVKTAPYNISVQAEGNGAEVGVVKIAK